MGKGFALLKAQPKKPLAKSAKLTPIFVLLLLAYAVSGEKTLSDFFAALKPARFLLMAVWERNKCPVSSTLSRFLKAIDDCSLEKLRTLFEQDLWERGFKGEDKGGLVDRTGERYWLFDLDGTKQVARQRALTSQEEYPPGQRRSGKACAKGYRGRKRGQVVRTRSTIAQAHTSEWLGTFGAPGNGTPEPERQRACFILYGKPFGLQHNWSVLRPPKVRLQRMSH